MQASAITAEKRSGREKATPVVLLAIIFLQVVVVLFWMTQKKNLFLDELTSFGNAQAYSFHAKNTAYINDSSAWEYESWVDNHLLKGQLEVSKEESLLSQPPQRVLKMLLMKRNYNGVLNILMSVFAPDSTSIYPGILFNIILFFFTQLLLYRIVKEISGSCLPALGAVLMYGFSAMGVEMTLFIRFYSLVIFLLLGALRVHQKMWRTEKIGLFELQTAFSFLLLYLAFKNSELVFIFAGALVLSFSLALVCSRRCKKALLYLLTAVPAGLYFAQKKNLIDILLHPAEYTGMGWPLGVMTKSVLEMNPLTLAVSFRRIMKWFAERLLGSRLVLYAFAGIVLILFVVWLVQRKKNADQSQQKECKNGSFFWILFGVAAIYFLFCVLTSCPANRYLSFIFPLVSMMLWCALSLTASDTRIRKWVLPACVALTLYGSFLQQVVNHDYAYLYSEDEEAIRAVEDSGVENAIFIFENDFFREHAEYDCVYLLPKSAQIYLVNADQNRIDADKCPDSVLIWALPGTDIDCYAEELTSGAYHTDILGKTHASVIYLARRITGMEEP